MEDSVFDRFRQSALDWDPESWTGVTERYVLEELLTREGDHPLIAPLVTHVLLLETIRGDTREEIMASIRDLLDGSERAVAIRAETVITGWEDWSESERRDPDKARATFDDFQRTYPQELRALYAILKRSDDPDLPPPGPRAKTLPLIPGKVLKFEDPNEVVLVEEPRKPPPRVLPFKRRPSRDGMEASA